MIPDEFHQKQKSRTICVLCNSHCNVIILYEAAIRLEKRLLEEQGNDILQIFSENENPDS